MRVCDAAAAVLDETNNSAVMWGDTGLLHLIAERAGMPSRDRAWKTENAVLRALTAQPGRLVPGYTLTGAGRRVRIFRMPDVHPDDIHQCDTEESE